MNEEVRVSDDVARRNALVEMLDGFNRHDLDAIMSLFADDCVFDSPRGPDAWGRRFVGRDQVREASAHGSREFSMCTTATAGTSSRVIEVSEWTLTGTTIDGERLEVRGWSGPSRGTRSCARTLKIVER